MLRDVDIRKLLDELPHNAWRGQEQMSAENCYPRYVELATQIEPRSILEIGAFQGFGLISFLCGWPKCEDVAWVDPGIYRRESNAECMDNLAWFRSRYGVNPFVTCHTRLCDVNAETGEYSLIHVDGGHTQYECLVDLAYAFALQPRVILVDDYDWHTEVREAVHHFAKQTGAKWEYVPSLRGWARFDL